MTDPIPPGWLEPGRVATWLRLDPVSDADAATLAEVCPAVALYVERARQDGWIITDADVDPGDPVRVYVPAADIMQGAIMFAARVFRRRNTPGGVEMFGDALTYVANYDPEVQTFLRRGPYRIPVAR